VASSFSSPTSSHIKVDLVVYAEVGDVEVCGHMYRGMACYVETSEHLLNLCRGLRDELNLFKQQ
jgi:hypothetical protein